MPKRLTKSAGLEPPRPAAEAPRGTAEIPADAQPQPETRTPAPAAPEPDDRLRPAAAASTDAPAVVGIGTSFGGFEAFGEFLENLPERTGMAFVLLPRLDPKHENLIGPLLARKTKLPVKEVKQGDRVQADHLYVVPPNANMTIRNGVLRLAPRTLSHGQHMPVDIFMRSLAADRHNRAVGVILSGTSTDGALGIKAIKEEGGITFAQEPFSAKRPEMPAAAISTGCVDFIMEPAGIAREATRIGQHFYVNDAAPEEAVTPGAGSCGARTADDDAIAPRENNGRLDLPALQRILILLRNSVGVDFTQYKPSTTYRRVRRRMALLRINDLEEYAQFLRGNEAELLALYHDVLIKATGFFRDPAIFETIKKRVFPRIFKGRPRDQPVRIWVPGCSTGEGAYSLAICLSEYLGRRRVEFPVQIFATDLNEPALEHAREGAYIENIALDVSPERLRRFFVRNGQRYQVSKSIRNMVIFARQNLAKDPPFARLDLIWCRNVLVYLEPSVQKRIVSLFHYALRPPGYLVLGGAESISKFTDLFSPVDKTARIFIRCSGLGRPRVDLPFSDAFTGEAKRNSEIRPVTRPSAHLRPAGGELSGKSQEPPDAKALVRANEILLQRYTPPGVVVNGNFDVVQFHGQGHIYIKPASGKTSFNLLKLVKRSLAVHLRAAVAAGLHDRATVNRHVAYEDRDATREIQIEVVPLTETGEQERYFLILFHPRSTLAGQLANPRETSADAASAEARSNAQEALDLEEIRHELAATREHLQAIIKEQDAANEEIRSANETILCSNEELQSTNEELEVAKEELQSSNEELITLSEELQARNAELANANNDLVNLVNSINLAIVMLGNDGRIRRFTGWAGRVFNLIPGDIGRPFSDIRSNLQVPNLAALVQEVMDTFSSKDLELQDGEGRWYSMSIRPYRTSDNRVDGAVLTLVDIHELRRSIEAAKSSRDFSQAVIGIVREPIVVLDTDLKVKSANAAFYEMFATSAQASLGQPFHNLTDGRWNILRLRRLLKRVLETGSPVQEYLIDHDFRELGRKRLLLNARRIDAEEKQPSLILLAFEDITDQKRAEQEVLAVSERERRRMAQELHDGLGQQLTAITFVAQTLLNQLRAQDYAEAARNCQQLVSQVSEATALTRDLAKGLHPIQLQANQFQTAMQALASSVSGLFKVVCTFNCDQPCLPPANSEEAATQLYRITQEAINNALNHGKETR
ncbi:MAG: PAS domain-containing protein, partial [Verrucomicrobia bacterium]|nr:PAS domain-containing protein [Verrucomicrobiota bacterium]